MVKFECPYCGYSMQTAQYLNGKGHCLKCDQIVADTEKHPLNPEWTRKMRAKFDKLNSDGVTNKNGMGTLDFAEMSALLKLGRPDFTDDELREIFDKADGNGNGVIEFSEFLWFLYSESGAAKQGAKQIAGRANHRGAGEASTFKLAPSDACESESGVCPKADGKPHHFKFGKCSYCGAPEGQLNKGKGTMQNPGGHGGCVKGGKCMYKFGKCSKCGAKEF